MLIRRALQQRDVNGGDVTLAPFRPGEQVTRMLPDNENRPVDAALADALRARVHGPVQAIDGQFYLGGFFAATHWRHRISYHFRRREWSASSASSR